MKKLALTAMLLFLISLTAIAKEDPNVKNMMGKYKRIMNGAKLFKLKEAVYDKNPSTQDGTNVYTMTLKTKGKKGKAIFTFVKFPLPKSADEKSNEIIPEYQTVTLEAFKYSDRTKKMDKEVAIPLHLTEPETIAVYKGQKLIITWQGDGGWGAKGFHLYSYNEKP